MKDFSLSYDLTELLASKTLRSTHLASRIREPQQKVIVKIFAQECAGQNQQESLLHINALLSLNHPYIIPILDIAVDEQGKPYIVSEYRPHGSLRQRLDRLSSERMDWQEAIDITLQIGQALSYAHKQQITHGNIKPENIFYNDAGEVQLTDFSLAPFVDITKLEYKSDLHTTRYMAPEQFVGKIDQQSDQYALACLTYELIIGHTPFDAQSFSAMWGKHATEFAPSLSSRLPRLPMSLDFAILKALAKKPEERHVSIDAFLTAITPKTSLHPSSIPPMSLSSSFTNANTSPLHTLIGDPFFAELANRTFGPDTMGEHKSVSSSSVWERHPSLASNDKTTGKLSVNTNSMPSIPSVHASTPSTFTARESAKIQSIHGQKTEEVVLSDEQIIAEVSAVAKQRSKRRSYLVRISILAIAIILIGLLVPYFLNFRPTQTARIGTIITPANTPVQSVQSIQNATATTTTTAKQHTANKVTLQSPNKQSEPVITDNSITVVPTFTGVNTPIPQPTRPASHIPPPITPTLPPQPVPTATPIPRGIGSVKIDAGGAGTGSFVADENFTSTTSGRPSSATQDFSSPIDTSGVSNPAPQSAYQSARIGDCLYTIANLTPGASYTVRLHFAEIYWTMAGKRTFNVLINSQLVLGNFDIFATAGAQNKAVVEEFVVPADSQGNITIQFATVKDNAQINAIEVLAI